jgi:hypothetical protein
MAGPDDGGSQAWFAEAVLEIFFGVTKRQQETGFSLLFPHITEGLFI